MMMMRMTFSVFLQGYFGLFYRVWVYSLRIGLRGFTAWLSLLRYAASCFSPRDILEGYWRSIDRLSLSFLNSGSSALMTMTRHEERMEEIDHHVARVNDDGSPSADYVYTQKHHRVRERKRFETAPNQSDRASAQATEQEEMGDNAPFPSQSPPAGFRRDSPRRLQSTSSPRGEREEDQVHWTKASGSSQRKHSNEKEGSSASADDSRLRSNGVVHVA